MDKDSFNHHTKITAPELATLWSQYMNDSLSRCILRYFVHHVKGMKTSRMSLSMHLIYLNGISKK